MCVAATARRRRRQMCLDRRYKRRDPFATARREAQKKATASRIQQGKKK